METLISVPALTLTPECYVSPCSLKSQVKTSKSVGLWKAVTGSALNFVWESQHDTAKYSLWNLDQLNIIICLPMMNKQYLFCYLSLSVSLHLHTIIIFLRAYKSEEYLNKKKVNFNISLEYTFKTTLLRWCEYINGQDF